MDRNEQQAAADAPPDGSSDAPRTAEVTTLSLNPSPPRAAAADPAPADAAPPQPPSPMQEAHDIIDAFARADAGGTAAPSSGTAGRRKFAFALPVFPSPLLGALKPPPQLLRHAAYGVAAAIALAAGWAGAALIAPGPAQHAAGHAIAGPADAAARLDRLSADMKTLRESVAALSKSVRPRAADDLKPLRDRVAELGESVNRLRADQATRIAALAENADKTSRDAASRLAQIAERLDRIDRGAPLTTGSIAAPEPSIPTPPPRPAAESSKPVGAAGPVQPQDRKALAGWTLRDIYDGLALIENRRVGLIEVAPGQIVRGLGRIEKIEQRGGRWVVVTQQGVIAAN